LKLSRKDDPENLKVVWEEAHEFGPARATFTIRIEENLAALQVDIILNHARYQF
jgi:hypothetical protein